MQELDVAKGTLPAGFQFGAYVIGGCIGQGGMARIYRAEHRVLHKPVALKVMESALLERPDGRPRFLREGQAAAAVKHPNVVDITDVGVWQGRPYLVMELLEGEDLEQYLSRHKPLAEHDVARIMIPLIAGLATAHGAGVIHRDLKPSNVFLARGPDGDVVPKLLDFGISKLANALRTLDHSCTPQGELMGSPMYMSPEAVRGARDLSPQSDQYSLGVMLYECVTGRPPFYADTLLGVLEAVAHGQFESPRRFRPELSTVLEVAILRAMSHDPADRFPSVRELGRALCEAADQRTRLLWTPSFGLRDVPLHRDTTNLGSLPPRTDAPWSSSASRHPSRLPIWQVGLTGLSLLAAAFAAVVYFRGPAAPVGSPVEGTASGTGAAAAPSVPRSGALPPAAARSPAVPAPSASEPGTPASAASASAAKGLASAAPHSRGPAARAHQQEAARQAAEASEALSARANRPDAPARAVVAAARRPSSSSMGASASRRSGSPRPEERSLARAASLTEPASGEQARRGSTASGSTASGTSADVLASGEDDEVFFPPPARSRPSPVLGANRSPILD